MRRLALLLVPLLLATPSLDAQTRRRLPLLVSQREAVDPTPSNVPPAAYKRKFLTWREKRVDYLVKQARNAPVDYTFYFSSSDGDDGNDGQSPEAPLQSITVLNVVLPFFSGQKVEIKLKRGDSWRGGFNVPSSGTFKITAYGDENDPKPLITMFDSTGYLDADDAWTLDSGNLYKKTIAPEKGIGWIRDKNDPYNPYTYLTQSSDVALFPYSWTQEVISATYTADAGTDVITSAGHGLSDGNLVWLTTTNSAPGNLSTRTNYYVINATTDTFQLATTPGGVAINISSPGSGTQTWNKPGDLYINAGGNDPNDLDFEVMPDFNDHTEGWSSNSNGNGNIYYLADVLFEGHGVSPYQDASRGIYNVHPGVRGPDIFVAERVEAYYNGRHAIGHTNGSNDGGIFVLKDCAAGYGSIDSTSYVSFSGGNGLESHYEGTSNPFGKLPSNGYSSTYGPVWPGGPANSGLYAHTAGGLLGLVTVWDHEFGDLRGTYPRATYELGDITAANLPGTETDISSLRAFFHHKPIERLVETAAETVTVNPAIDAVTHAGNTFSNGDLIEMEATTTIPGGITARRSYAVMGRSVGGYQLGLENLNISSIDTSTDTITCVTSTAFVENARVNIIAEFGQLPGGLSASTAYYVKNLSGANLQLSLTPGGDAVDITDAGFGRFRLYGRVVDITSTGSGTLTVTGVKTGQSGFVRYNQSTRALYINNKKVGLQFQTYGSATNTTSLNQITYTVNPGLSTTAVSNGGGRHYHGHFAARGRGNFWYLNVSSSADATLFNSIVALQQNILTAFNVPNDVANQRGNAYWDPSSNATLAAATTADDYKVTLSARPVVGAAPTSQYDNDGYPSPLGIGLEYDFNFDPRNTGTPSVGPIK